ncbi:MAG: hypothetical protein ICV73_05490, partial [Acetobacteraceae bacterium]|nr:hypothetical protein [Acetobacteraceae bacterium]
MNWRRGLMRAWLFVSVPWAVFFVGLALVTLTQESNVRGSEAESFLAVALLPPLALLATGFSLRWVLMGFR